MQQWCKIIERDGRQYLATVTPDSDSEGFLVRCEAWLGDCHSSVELEGFETFEDAQEALSEMEGLELMIADIELMLGVTRH